MVSPKTLPSTLNIETLTANGITWVNIPRPSRAEMAFLQEHYPFHPLDLDDCLSKVQNPKLDEYPDYLFLVLHFPLFKRETRLNIPSQVAIFVGTDYVVTAHQGELRPLVKLFQDCQQSEEVRQQVISQSSGQLLYRILDRLVDSCFLTLNRISENVDGVEDRVFDQRDRALVGELSAIRRDIISYWRIIRPQTVVLESLERKEYHLLKVNPEVYFGDLADHMRRLSAELEELREVMEVLKDTHLSLVYHHTNEVVRILTIIATIMLPLSVLSGIYGMNVSLPWGDSPYAFALVLLMMAGIAGAMLVFFWSRKWI